MAQHRFTRWLVCGAALAAAAGCGNHRSRVLAPAPGGGDASVSAARVWQADDAPRRAGIPPMVQITCPEPSALFNHLTPPALRIVWDGSDPDGRRTDQPVQYKFILLGPGSEFPVPLAVANPDSLRRYYANHPSGPWAGWDSTGADTREARFGNLIPEADYLFAVIAFDETGLYSPVFSLTTNMLRFRVTYDGYPGPALTVSGPGLLHSFTGYNPAVQAHIQVEAGRLVAFNWSAEAGGTCGGVTARAYRWTLDIADLSDKTPRTGPNDLAHWSAPALDEISATVGPFVAGEAHLFYVDVEDNVGVRSLGTVQILVVASTNHPPDCAGATATIPGGLAPNGSFAPVTIAGVTDPDGDPIAITVTGITQDEPVEAGGTCPDAMIASGAAQVRCERAGSGNGRVYTISFTASDGRGGTCSGSADVCIPHDRGRGGACIKDALSVNSLGPCGTGLRRADAP